MTVRARPRLRRSCLVAAVLLVAACGNPVPTPPPSTNVTPASSPAMSSPVSTPIPTAAVATVPPYRPTARPPGTPPSGTLPSSATVERDGIRFTLRLSANPLDAGSVTIARVTIENTDARRLMWSTDGCAMNAGIHAVVAASWRDSDVEVSPELVPYRDWFREEADIEQPISIRFDLPSDLGHRPYGCADLAIGQELGPGRKVTQELMWDGDAAPRLGLPPTAPVTLTATFGGWSRPGPGRHGAPLAVTLDSWILNGRRDDYLSPAEAIDAALADEGFASWLLTRAPRSGANPIAEFDQDLGLWAVGLLMYRDQGDPILHAAFVDAMTGEVIAVREHRVVF